MRCAWLVVTGCWTAPVVTPPVAKPVGHCAIHDADVSTADPVALSVRGAVFATINDTLSRLDVTVTRAVAHARLDTDRFELDGDIALAELAVRPRERTLHDGWVEVWVAHGTSATGDALLLDVPLPRGLEPRSIEYPVRCRDLTFAAAEPVESAGDLVLIVARTRLYKAPGGPAVASIVPPSEPAGDEDSIYAHAFERRGTMLRVRIEDPNAVEGWIRESATRQLGGPGGGGTGYGTIGTRMSDPQCTHALPIFVRIDGDVLRVGKFKPNVRIRIKGDRQAAELIVDLGDSKLPAFVRRAELESCAP